MAVSNPAGRTIAGVAFDLDDTLFAQAEWLDGAWSAVAAAAPAGLSSPAFEAALREIASEGSARGRIIDRALESVGRSDLDVAPLIAVFRSHAPRRLEPFVGVADALDALAARVPLGLISDGDPLIQRAKLRALGLDHMFAAPVWSDELGRRHRKPDPAPFRVALSRMGVEAAEAVYVGDRPDKDVAGAVGVGMRAIRVRTGEYTAAADLPDTWATVADVVDAIELVIGLIEV